MFRNEISPKGGLLRVKEFCVAEIEHFCDPNDKRSAAFQNVKDEVLCLFSGENQLTTGKTQLMKIGDGVAQKLLDNEARGGRQDHWRAAWTPSACASTSTSRLLGRRDQVFVPLDRVRRSR